MVGIDETPTTPTQPRRHSTPLRGLETVPSSPFFDGRFGRMFRNLPVFEPKDSDLENLAQSVIQPAEEDKAPGEPDEDENTEIPAGYAYLGQFLDHDITFDPASSLQRQNDPDALRNFRTPRFDLDSLYGRGPADQPYMYQEDGVKLLTGRAVSADAEFAGPDLPRNVLPPDAGGNLAGRALIGDPRNDENIIVSQLHSLFVRFHNRMVDVVSRETGLTSDDLFKETQRRVRWHYQWAVVHDFLPRVLGSDIQNGVGQRVINDILEVREYLAGVDAEGQSVQAKIVTPNLRFFHWRENPFVPVEFSAAAYRFGHSMVRPSYFFNDRVRHRTRKLGRTPIFTQNLNDPLDNLNGFRPLPNEWGVQWKFFFDLQPYRADRPPQASYKIDSQLVNPLGNLPPAVATNPSSLAERNLKRGKALGLPSGQSVARAMGISPLTDAELGLGAIPLT